ncbi:transporter substrate-binding protein [Oscillatoria sp. FACHB-1406]|uniref:transporter substrate-binding protein n=1 Tax=Oscillatoria sp. FACHB-1406 TaxID=2692846 RepID=UPI001684FBF9|nr:transporter substrate-binding protein [Oscillatoria sp. FACHB-1406]MBD2580039.1 transporter substrate-binding protein [Oscillatoria sp. FACHB-1406]
MSSVRKPTSNARIRVGILHSQSGTMALSERPLIDAVLMAIAEINETGGVLNCEIEPVILNGASAPDEFAEQARRAIQQLGVMTIFGCWTSRSRKAVKPIIEELNALLWYPLQYEGLESSPHIFYTGSCPNQQIEPAIAWLLQNRGKRFYLLGSNYVFPRTAHQLIRSRVQQQGGAIIGEEFWALGTKNFAATIANIQALRPDVIFNTLNGDSNPAFYQQYRDAGITADEIPILATSVSEIELQKIGSAANGHYACWNYFQSLATPENQAFIRNFRARYGSDRVTSDPIASSYSQVYLWKQAVEAAGSFEVEEIATAAIGQQFASPGGQIAIAPNHHVCKPYYIGRAGADGQFEIVSRSLARVEPLPWLGVEQLDFENAQTVIDLLAAASEGFEQISLNEQKSRELETINQQLQQEVNQHQLTELALAESQSILSTLMNNLPGMVYHCLNDENWTMLFVSDGCKELTGYSADNFTIHHNISYEQLIRPQDREIVRTAVKIAIDSRTSFQITYGITSATGEFKWVWEQGRGVFDSIGQLLYLEGFIADITVRVRAQDALIKSEERWQLALRGNNDGIFDLNYQTGEVFYSSRWKEMLGYENDELSNCSEEWDSRIHPDDYDRIIAAKRAHLAKETPYFCEEYRLRCKDGSYKWVLGRGQALWDKEGQPARMVGSHTDITARKQTEEALRQSEERWELALRGTGDGIFDWNIVTGEAFASARLWEMLGYGDGELEASLTLWRELVHPDDYQHSLAAINKHFEGRTSQYVVEHRLRCKDSTYKWILARGQAQWDEAGMPLRMVGSYQDISDRKAAEEEIQLLLDLSQAVSAAADFETALGIAVEQLCETTGWIYAEAWVPTEDNSVLACSPQWYAREIGSETATVEAISQFRTYSEALTFLPDEDIPGAVWSTQKPLWMTDWTQIRDVLLRQELALECGFKVAFGVPILANPRWNLSKNVPSLGERENESSSDLLAVLVFFTLDYRLEDKSLRDLVKAAAAQLGTILQQKKAQAEMEALFAAMTDVVTVRDVSGLCLNAMPTKAEKAYRQPHAFVGRTLHEEFPQEQADLILNAIQQAVSTQKAITIEYSVPLSTRAVWFADTISPLSEESAILVTRDISDRKIAEESLRYEQQKSEQLLLNILPESIAHQLKHNPGAIAKHFDEVSILFADIVGFTPLSSQLSPIELVNLLNDIFSNFDILAERFGLEKIKTIGDAYMVAAGLPIPRPDHAEAIADMALAMQDAILACPNPLARKIEIRIGINSGAAVAGVIGTKKFIYDLWGDAVNIASRMESCGKPGRIQITAATYDRIKHKFKLEKRGSIYVKGKGEMITYWLLNN